MPDADRAMKLLISLLVAGLPIACGSTPGGVAQTCVPACDKDTSVCVITACVRIVTPPSSWMAEITPPPGAGAAVTEEAFPHGGGLAADAATSVAVAISYPTNVPAPSNAHLILAVPSAIPGRPDLTFESVFVPRGPTPVANVPSAVVGMNAMAAVTIVPLPPDDATSPPRSTSVKLASSISVAFPSGDHAVSGLLLESDNTPPANPFAARAFVAGTSIAVSNRPMLGSDGSFSLLVPGPAAAMPLVVELVSTSGSDPSFASSPIPPPAGGATSVGLGTIVLPSYTSPNQFAFRVEDQAQQPEPVAGALVTASTTLSQASAGARSSFMNGGVTADNDENNNHKGVALLTLLPGTASTNLSYEIAVVPPAGSPLATSCFAQMVGSGGTASSPALQPPMQLPRRRTLSGTVTADGVGVADVVVSATSDLTPVATCTRTSAAPGETTTDSQGHYELPLDPGSYRLDYDPPAGSPFARVTSPNGVVAVTAGADPAGGDVTLPMAGLVTGKVTGPATMAGGPPTTLAGATVRIFQPQCSTSTTLCGRPLLLGQGQSDASGRFLIVVGQ
jgi:hypothetical protein